MARNEIKSQDHFSLAFFSLSPKTFLVSSLLIRNEFIFSSHFDNDYRAQQQASRLEKVANEGFVGKWRRAPKDYVGHVSSKPMNWNPSSEELRFSPPTHYFVAVISELLETSLCLTAGDFRLFVLWIWLIPLPLSWHKHTNDWARTTTR